MHQKGKNQYRAIKVFVRAALVAASFPVCLLPCLSVRFPECWCNRCYKCCTSSAETYAWLEMNPAAGWSLLTCKPAKEATRLTIHLYVTYYSWISPLGWKGGNCRLLQTKIAVEKWQRSSLWQDEDSAIRVWARHWFPAAVWILQGVVRRY